MTEEYKIERWDPIIITGNIDPYPMIYIKNLNLTEKFQKKNSLLIVKIFDSNSIYDNKEILAYPDFLSDFIVLTLFCSWNGYPPQNGKISIKFLSSLKQDSFQSASQFDSQSTSQSKSKENYNNVSNLTQNSKIEKNISLSFKQIIIIIFLIFILFLSFLFFQKKIQKNKKIIFHYK